MKTIFKYELSQKEVQVIEMPIGSDILCVQVQSGIPCIWAKVESDNELEERIFLTATTGYPLYDNPIKYISTYQLLGGEYIAHVFELM